MNIRQSSRKYIVPPVPSSPLGQKASSSRGNPPYGDNNNNNKDGNIRPAVRFRRTASSLRIIATKGNATLAAGLSYPKILNPDLELYLQFKKKEHDFAEAIVPAVAPFQYIPSSAKDELLSPASARIYLPPSTDMKLKTHMRVVQSQQLKTIDISPFEESLEPQLHHTPSRLKKDEKKSKKADDYDAIYSNSQTLISPKSTKEVGASGDKKSARKKSLLNMKDLLPSARGKEKARAAAWEASRESWFAEAPQPPSNPSSPKARGLSRASSFGSPLNPPAVPHSYIPSTPNDKVDNPLRPRSRTAAPPVMQKPPAPMYHPPSSSPTNRSSPSTSSSPSPVSPSRQQPKSPTSPLNPNSPNSKNGGNLPNGSLPVFLARGRKVHSDYDVRRFRNRARNSVGLDNSPAIE